MCIRDRYDLAEEWFKYTNLPFVFACWVANKPLSDSLKQQFSDALKYGLDHKALVVDEYTKNQNTNIDLERYFSAYISWNFDAQKKSGLKKFLTLSRNL